MHPNFLQLCVGVWIRIPNSLFLHTMYVNLAARILGKKINELEEEQRNETAS